MEIHPPRRPIASFKEFSRELLVVTVGILIALALEGIIEWRHHSELAHEARSNILSELRENQRELEKEQQDLQKMQHQAETLVQQVHQIEANRKTDLNEFSYIFSLAELHATSWDTAKATGVLQYMPYPEVKRFTEVYDLQQDFLNLEQRGFAASLDVEALATLVQRGTSTLTSPELMDAEKRIGIAAATVSALQQFAVQLAERYQKLLSQ